MRTLLRVLYVLTLLIFITGCSGDKGESTKVEVKSDAAMQKKANAAEVLDQGGNELAAMVVRPEISGIVHDGQLRADQPVSWLINGKGLKAAKVLLRSPSFEKEVTPTYAIDDEIAFQDEVIAGLPPGTYDVIVKNDKGMDSRAQAIVLK